MSALAHAIKIEDIEADETLVAEATKDCFACDLDNPRRVKRETCSVCKGTGREPLAALEISRELRESKKEAGKKTRGASRSLDGDDDYDGDADDYDDSDVDPDELLEG